MQFVAYSPYAISFIGNYLFRIQDVIFTECFVHGCLSFYFNFQRSPYAFLYSFNHFIIDTFHMYFSKFHKGYFIHHVFSILALYYIMKIQSSQHPEVMNFIHDTTCWTEATAPLLALTYRFKNHKYYNSLNKVYVISFYLIRFFYGPYALLKFTYISLKYNTQYMTGMLATPLAGITLYGMYYSRKMMIQNNLLR